MIPIGIQNFEKIRRNNMFYVDKTEFIEKWWHSQIDVTVITRPRRFGKTLMMATIVPPEILLLDEHTAALDPATAEKVLELTKSIVEENGLTCMMITHNMQSALELGNRTLMLDAGGIIMDVSGEERSHMCVQDFLDRFKAGAGKSLCSDRMLLI